MKIRIGNDIRLYVSLLSSKVTDSVNINSVKAFIINASKQKEAYDELKNKTKFISRFPVEPYVSAYSSTAYDIKSSGYPTWRAYPQNYVIGSYAGFGVEPDWNSKHQPMPVHNLTEYQAEVKATKVPNKVQVFFPAEAQLFTGDYNLIIVAKIYEPGYASNNLRTVTMDYENIFTLVNTSEEGVDSDVTLQVGSTPGDVTQINISGDTACSLGGNGNLQAEVLPVDAVEDGVIWSVDPKDALYIVLTHITPTRCRYHAVNMPSGVNEYVATIIAKSTQESPEIVASKNVTIRRDGIGDTHVNDGQLVDKTLVLNLSDGESVNIDMTGIAGWHEE